MSILTCRNVCFAYEGREVLTGVDFSIDSGDYLCIVGENGAGKSTLIKGLLNLKKPSRGTIETSGGLKPSEIGYLPQQTAVQRDFPASVFEVVLSGRLNSVGFRPFYSKEDRRMALDVMDKLGMGELKNHCYRELSGGQQQRTLLARALCATKKLLLLDEPMTGLDPIMAAELYSIIARLNLDDGITVIAVTHDVKGAMDHASHVLQLGHSQLFFGTADDYKASDAGKRFLSGGAEQ